MHKVRLVVDRGCQPEPERKSLMLEYVNSKYQNTSGPMLTDGSAAEATRNEGGGVYIRDNDGKVHISNRKIFNQL